LNEEGSGQVKVLQYFISLIDCFTKLNNFSGVFAILKGFRQSSIGQSKKFSQFLDAHHRQIYETVALLCSKKSNFKNYRRSLSRASIPCLPYSQMWMSELKTQIEGDPIVDGNRINFEKCTKLSDFIESIQRFQVKYYHLQNINCVQKWINGLRHDIDTALLFKRTQIVKLIDGLSSCVVEQFQNRLRDEINSRPNKMKDAHVCIEKKNIFFYLHYFDGYLSFLYSF
jgi:hypothetical protein